MTAEGQQSVPAFRLSVALVTRNRPEILRRCLESWRAQTRQPDELVISDDSDPVHTEATRALAQEFGARHVQGPRRGLYANRNCAAAACTGTHVLTADDDHTHPRDYVESVMRQVESDPKRVWIFGEKYPDRPDEALLCPAELGDGGAGVAPADPDRCAAIADGSTVYPACVFAQGTVYDETYPFGHLWYLLGWQLRLAGWRISFSPSTHVWHHIESTAERASHREFLRRQMEANLYVFLVYAVRLRPSPRRIARAFLMLSTAVFREETIVGYDVSARVGIGGALHAVVAMLKYSNPPLEAPHGD